jgi:hypothetical protein
MLVERGQGYRHKGMSGLGQSPGMKDALRRRWIGEDDVRGHRELPQRGAQQRIGYSLKG